MGTEMTATTKMTLPQLLKTDRVNSRFKELLGAGATNFVSSILTMYKENKKLQDCDPISILTAAGQAANLKLSIMPQRGYAYVIPYYDYKSGKYMAQFQIGYKGLIQLAMRSGQVRKLNCAEIYEGQIKQFNPITGDVEWGEIASEKVVGYAAYMELINGFSKLIYMSKADVERHAMNFSESYRNEKTRERSVWAKNFDAMAKKTVMKKLLTTYAPMSTEMQEALQVDDTGKISAPTYDPKVDDVAEFDTIDIETGEVLNDETESKAS